MRSALAASVLVFSLAGYASARPLGVHIQPSAATVTPEGGIQTRRSTSDPAWMALQDANSASRLHQEEFDARLSERGKLALSSVCDACGTGTILSKTGRGPVTRSVLSSHLADAESIYSRRSGFDPAQAPVD